MSTLNQNELARLFEVTPKTVRAWEAAGCPVARKSTRKGEPTLYDTAAVIAWRVERAGRAALGDMSAWDLQEARRRKLAAQALRAEMELERMRAGLVEVAVAHQVVGGMFAAIRARCLRIGEEAARRLQFADSTAARQAVVDEVIHEALAEISGEPERFVGGSDDRDA